MSKVNNPSLPSQPVERFAPGLQSLLVSIDAVYPDPANVRSHPERNAEVIVNSLRRFGQQRPILCAEDGRIIAGNGTYAAAKRLGWTQVAVTRSELAGVDATAYALVDNRSAELAEWDDEALRVTLDSLSADVDIAELGWTDEELAGLGDENLGGEGEGDEGSISVTISAKLAIPPRVWLQQRDEVMRVIGLAAEQYGVTCEWPE